MKKKVMIGMSGGVDSSVAAYLLKEQGFEVIGITLKLWDNDNPEIELPEGGCCSLASVNDAREVACKLGIPHYVFNFKEIFRKKVIDPFIEDYICGKTPNPCVLCNKYIKFEELLQRSQALDADYIATGHYARIEQLGDRYLLKTAKDSSKDQTYALYNMTQYQLARTLMPCSEFTKREIREMAEKIGLCVHNKKDSQEICFIPDNDHGRYIKEAVPERVIPGNFVDNENRIIGKHKGICYYTIGQRKGLGIAAGKRIFVTAIRPETNEIVLGAEEDIFTHSLITSDLNFIPFDCLNNKLSVTAKIRYSATAVHAEIAPINKDSVQVTFKDKVRAATPGQSVVFYDKDVVVGGGIINKVSS